MPPFPSQHQQNIQSIKPTQEQVEDAIQTLIRWIGDNPQREGLKETPRRMIQAFETFYSGYTTDPVDFLQKTFEETEGYDEIIVLRNIPLFSHCEHHMLPIIGKASVGYLPNHRVVGISKLARVVQIYSRRLQMQEKMTAQIANTINNILQPLGIGVIIEAEHFCMSARGAQSIGSTMITSRMLGEFRTNPSVYREFLCFHQTSPSGIK